MNRKRKITLIIISVILLIIISLGAFQLSLFHPIGRGRLTEAQIYIYNKEKGSYHELTITDKGSLDTLLKMKDSLTGRILPLNSRLIESERFQKDSHFVFYFYYDSGIIQRIETTGDTTAVFNYHKESDYSELCLINKSNFYDIALSRDGMCDYALQLSYDAQSS